MRPHFPYVAERLDRGRFFFEMPRAMKTEKGRLVAVSSPLQSIILSYLSDAISSVRGLDRKLPASCGSLPSGRGPQAALGWMITSAQMASCDGGEATVGAVDVRNAYPSLSGKFAVEHARGLGVREDVLAACTAFLQLVNRDSRFPGLPPGAPISASLADVALEPLDRALAGWAYDVIRYVDNLGVIVSGCLNEDDLRSMFAGSLREYEAETGTQLCLHDWRIARYSYEDRFMDRFSWLGHDFSGHDVRPSANSATRLAGRVAGLAHEELERGLSGFLAFYEAHVSREVLREFEDALRAGALKHSRQ